MLRTSLAFIGHTKLCFLWEISLNGTGLLSCNALIQIVLFTAGDDQTQEEHYRVHGQLEGG